MVLFLFIFDVFVVNCCCFLCGLKETEGNDRAVDWLNAARGRAVVGGDVNEVLFFSFKFTKSFFKKTVFDDV